MQEPNTHSAIPATLPAELILDVLSTAVILLDKLLFIRHVNSAGEQLLAQSARRLVGEPLPFLFDYLSLDMSRIRELLDTGHSFTDSEVTLVLGDGTQLLLDVTASALTIEHERFALLELRRIDKRRRITQEVQQAAQQQAARELIRSLAHEIKNPLGGLRGAAQLLEKELPDKELKEFTQIIIEQADRLRNLVDRLLGPQRPGHQGSHNIHEVLEKVRQLVSFEYGEKLVIDRDYDPSIPDFAMDPEQLQQAILNIVNNAVQALEGEGIVRLTTRIGHNVSLHGSRHRLVAEISVIDNGPGIPESLQDTLFYPMVSGKAGGTGLGLSISQTLVHRHGGKIESNSWPGHTEFTITLPLEKD